MNPGINRAALVRLLGLLLACLLDLLLAGPALSSATSDAGLPPDARSQGMGQAFTAVAEGPSAAWWNPGAFGLMGGVWVNPYGHIQLVPDLADDVVHRSFGFSIGREGRGLGIDLDHVRYEETTLVDFAGRPVRNYRPYEFTARAGAGVDVGRRILGVESGRLRLGAGLGLKYTRVYVSPDHDGLSGTGSGGGLDLGLLASYRAPLRAAQGAASYEALGREGGYYGLRAGWTVQNLIQRRIHFRGFDHPDPMGRGIRAGLAGEFALPALRTAPTLGPALQVIASVEDQQGFEWSVPSRPIWRAGLEATMAGLFSGRIGYVRNKEGDIVGATYGLGVGLQVALPAAGRFRSFGFRVDYADIPQSSHLSRVSHYSIAACLFY